MRRLAILPALALCLAGCASSSSGAGGAAKVGSGGGTVTVRMTTDWGLPVDGGHTASSIIASQLAEAMYDRLVTWDYQTGQVIPDAAKSWKVTGTSVTFTLRNDITCSDGAKITPQAVQASLERFIAPATGSRWPATVFGPGPYTLSNDSSAGTVTLAVGTPYNLLLQGFTWPWVGIICPAGLAQGADFAKRSYGTGPYVYQSSAHGVSYEMVKRPDRTWGAFPAGSLPDRLVYKIVTDETTTANLLVTGGLDIGSVSGPDTSRLNNTPSLAKLVAHSYGPNILQLNEDPSRATSDAKVREAITRAVGGGLNATGYNQAANQGTGVLSTNFQSNPGGYCYTDLSSLIPKQSVAAARSVLESAGYTLGGNNVYQKAGKPLSLLVVGVPSQQAAGPEYIQSQLTAMGAAVTLNNTDYGNFAIAFQTTKYDVLVGAFVTPVPVAGVAAQYFVGKLGSQGGLNKVNRSDPRGDQLEAEAYGAPPAQACAAWKAWNTYALQNFVGIPMVANSLNFYSVKSNNWAYAATASGSVDPSTIHRRGT